MMNDQNELCAYEQELLDQYARDTAKQEEVQEAPPVKEVEPVKAKKAK